MSTERKTRETRRVLRILLWHIAVLGVAIPGAAHQAGEKDLTESIRSLQAGAKAFRVRFEQAIRKSKVGNTIRGQNTRRLVRRFEWQTQAMRENFERTQEAGDVAPLFNTANRITAVVYGLRLGDKTEQDWENLRADLARVTNAAGVVPPADASCELSASKRLENW
jgi:hypothetical protein